MSHIVAIDPSALLLSSQVYIRLTLPDPPPIDVMRTQVREMVESMNAEERKIAFARADALEAYATLFKREIDRHQSK